MPRASRSAPRTAPESPSASGSAAPPEPPSSGGAEGAPGNGLLWFFGAIAVIFGFLSTVELLFGGRARWVFLATLLVCVLMVVLAAVYKAGWWRRAAALDRADPHPPTEDAPPSRQPPGNEVRG